MAMIQKRNNRYKITVSMGYDQNHKQVRKSFTWIPDPAMTPKQVEKEVQRQAVLFEEQCRNGQVFDDSIRLADFAEKWFKDYVEKQLKTTTIQEYKADWKRINIALGNIRLNKLKPCHILSFYNNLTEPGVRQNVFYRCMVDIIPLLKERNMTKKGAARIAGSSPTAYDNVMKGRCVSRKKAEKLCEILHCNIEDIFVPVNENVVLSSRTIRSYHQLLSSMLNTAVQWGIIGANPCERVKAPKLVKSEPRFLDEVQTARLLEILETQDMQFKTAIKLLLFTGFRRGELCGLEWDDIDFKNKTITVRRASYYRLRSGTFTDTPKSSSSIRTIKVSPSVIDILLQYKAWQDTEKLKIGDLWPQSNRLFLSTKGTPINPTVFTQKFHKLIVDNNFPSVCLHSLRHTNATLLIAAGAPITTVAGRLGHSNSAITAKVYAHQIKSADEAAAETLETLLNTSRPPILLTGTDK